MYVWAIRDQKRASDLLELELQTVVSCLTWVLGLELGLLEEQYMLLTDEPSLQAPYSLLKG